MGNRDYKQFVPGTLAHIYNRGNNREDIFRDEQDYRAFLFRLALGLGFEEKELDHPLISSPRSRIRITNAKKELFKLHGFCLMRNHFHMLIEQCSDIPISKLISKTCTSYARYYNEKYSRTGHVFQDKFKAVNINDHPQLMWIATYIHLNPVKGNLVKHPSQYKWSSYNDYLGSRDLPITYTEFILSTFGGQRGFEKNIAGFNLAEDSLSKTVFDMFI